LYDATTAVHGLFHGELAELLSPEEEGASHHAIMLVGGDQPRP